ncbi:Dopamine beta-hydroxylase [Halotydeus destructor]|nr:Dopamine beta-hydroxylase [Halotydeus destructor]
MSIRFCLPLTIEPNPVDDDPEPPIFQLPLDKDNKYRLFWTLDYKFNTVTIEIRAVLNKKTDWFAIGFSNYGNITEADLCLIWFDRKMKPHFDDTWTDELGFVNIDESNDCRLLNLTRKGSKLIVVYQRKFDTCDSRDYLIEDGTTHVVYATGHGPIKRAEGLNLVNFEHGFIRTRLLKNVNPVPEMPFDTRMVQVTSVNVQVPSDETTYWCSLHQLPPEMDTKHHIIQYEAVIQEGNEHLVHHMEVFHCELAQDVELSNWNGPCSDGQRPKLLDRCKRVIAAWAMGAGPVTYPEEAGLPIGGSNYSKYLMLEVHYDNAQHLSNTVDSSGIRFYYVERLRKYDIGILELGLEYTDKNSIPPGHQGFELSGYCVSECTRTSLASEGITIVASQLHTHLTGVAVWTKHVRGGKELAELNRDNHYSQHFQEIRLLKEPVQLIAGDALITTCRYDTTTRSNITLGGFAIREEMCVNYVHYYPKSDLEVCKSSIDDRFLAKFFDYLRDFEATNTSSHKGIGQNFNSVHWSPNKSKLLSQLYHTSPLSMQCNHSNGQRFPGPWEGIQLTQIYEKLEPKTAC